MIPEDDRRPEKELNAEYAAIKGKVFGSILDYLSDGLKNLPHTKLARLPRMADSIKWVSACFGNDAFMTAYRANEQEAVFNAIENSPVAKGIIELMEGKTNWEATPSELATALDSVLSYDQRNAKDYPQGDKALGKRIKRDMPLLKSVGIVVSVVRKNSGRYYRFEKTQTPSVTIGGTDRLPVGQAILSNGNGKAADYLDTLAILAANARIEYPDGRVKEPMIEAGRLSKSRFRFGWKTNKGISWELESPPSNKA
jgi:hypothetical protein